MKDFKAFTSAFKLLICSSLVSLTIGCLLEAGKIGVVCVCVEAELSDIDVRGWPGRGVISSLVGVIVLSAEWILECSSITPFARSLHGVPPKNSLSQLLAEGFFLLIF